MEAKFKFAKILSKLFPSVSYELLKVPWCFICQTKSPYVEIKWLKGYCIPSTFTENIPNQSWGSNRGTPCSFIARIISIVLNHKGPYVLPKCRQDNLIDVICPQPLASHNSLSETIYISNKYITKTIYWNYHVQART